MKYHLFFLMLFLILVNGQNIKRCDNCDCCKNIAFKPLKNENKNLEINNPPYEEETCPSSSLYEEL